MLPEIVSEIFVGLFVLACLGLWWAHEVKIERVDKRHVARALKLEDLIMEVRKERDKAVADVRNTLIGATSWENAIERFASTFPEPEPDPEE